MTAPRATPRATAAGRRPAALLAALAGALLAAPLAAQQPIAVQAVRNPAQAIILAPEPGERVLQDVVLVAVSFVDRDAQLDPATVHLEVDGRDVTAEADVSAELVSWKPRQPMDAGPHRVSLTARARDGIGVAPVSWTFTVTPGYETPAAAAQSTASATSFTRFQGSVTFEENGRSVSGPGAPRLADKQNVPQLWLDAGGLLGGSWRYSARGFVSAYESKDRQPVNRLRFDLRSNHLSAALGDVNPVLQDLMLAGERVRGFQADLKGGPVRLTVVKGSTRRSIEGLIDPTNATVLLRQGTYGQSLTAVRPAFGGDHLLVGLTALRVTDDTASIADQRISNGPNGATQRVNPSPKDNLVLGGDATMRILDSRVLLQYQGAFSLLANDISGGPITRSQLDSIMDAAGIDRIDVDPSDYSKWFVVNQSMIPLDPRGGSSLAHLASASLRAGTNIVTAEWRSIGGSYYSLGYPSLLRDRRGVRLRDSFSSLRGALAVAGGFETDQDNLDGVKPSTTTNRSVYAQASWQRSPRAVSLIGSLRQGSRSNDLAKGVLGALDETTNAVSLGAGIPIGQLSGLTHRLNLSVTAINRDDPANVMVDSKDRYFLFGFEGETESRSSTYNLMYGLNTTELESLPGSKTSFGRLAGNFRWLFRPRWTATVDGTYSSASSDSRTVQLGLDYARKELLGGAQFQWTEASFVTATAGVVSYADQLLPTRNTHEVVTRVTVHRTF